MQEFQFSEEQIMLRDMTRDFVNNEIKPIAAKIDAEEKIPAELRQKLGELGFLGVSFPEEYGGGGFGEVGYCVMQEEIARGCMSTATFIGAHQSIGSNVIYIGGTEEQKQKYLVPLAKGEKIGAFCLTEAQAGSDSFNVKTRAHLDGDEWVINGEKLWITNGAIADTVSVFARTDKGISAFIVETNLPGYHAGPAEKKMGIKGSTTNAITFDNVRIPKENLIGTEGRAFILAMKTLNAGRLGLGACCIGASKELLEMSVQYSKQRKQFDQTISNFQAIQFMIAEMATMIYAMESMVYRTAIDYDLKKDVSKASAIVKLYCSESLDKIADFAVQIYGGMGYSRELPIERYYRDSRINRIFEGTSEIQKGIIARELLKKNGAM
ncbi:MAG: acyl-CoA dehydrogenase [Stygiobacter sp. RIFOXYC12_FULL_38_8]|nr:MAG: acyl-CoA dehydrogenase [Stygiobacter sp. GWC2_38_9]OGU77828.1 MAG: acyl-CoA dehydrogenase [Stygiobacter sp. RIFOXYA12_FULL_38_9]OGV09162.1 MAG: acyl-CoA dehydrogenase [Stygiobacter sp. RIFOXYB2_FULL_37_11]OGV14096.1 MAG: acyl-CoA dehydrogenase [Stygiobacter sp. RIFOXYA2_FULL_38_8]OGV16393.1 MAG: acyl-CoA dehydrogenase [Stygiobacter sp. RIFOXYC2_FULL_38_25]OGV24403.1 MAG: acyl-CoA dehydrogenase [Stygiobacter sp. RIFOXYC12_FULL_38_8]OGV81733.1 MAG: acyl-CoA dehydrogenase [Stygiobacter s